MTKLTKLTQERRDIIDAIQSKWRAVGLCTNPADFGTTEEHLTFLYNNAGLDAPYFVKLSSPFAAEVYINLLVKTWPTMKDQLWDHSRSFPAKFQGQPGNRPQG